jgi:hypothetical protein
LIASSLTPSSRATAMAASALDTLCQPGIGQPQPLDRARLAVARLDADVELGAQLVHVDAQRAHLRLRG